MTTKLPHGAEPYKRTATFIESSIPAGLLANHSTKRGTWGLIHVQKGRLRYVVTDPRRPPIDEILASDTKPGVVEPTILHRVEPLGAVAFYVEFFRVPDAPA